MPQTFNKYCYASNRPTVAVDLSGLDTILILYATSDTQSGQSALKKAAEYRAKKANNNKKKGDEVVIKKIRNASDVKKFTSQKWKSGKISKLDIIAHGTDPDPGKRNEMSGSTTGPYKDKNGNIEGRYGVGGTELNKHSLSKSIDTSNMTSDATIDLLGCYTAKGGEHSLAQAIADNTGLETTGVTGEIQYPNVFSDEITLPGDSSYQTFEPQSSGDASQTSDDLPIVLSPETSAYPPPA